MKILKNVFVVKINVILDFKYRFFFKFYWFRVMRNSGKDNLKLKTKIPNFSFSGFPSFKNT